MKRRERERERDRTAWHVPITVGSLKTHVPRFYNPDNGYLPVAFYIYIYTYIYIRVCTVVVTLRPRPMKTFRPKPGNPENLASSFNPFRKFETWSVSLATFFFHVHRVERVIGRIGRKRKKERKKEGKKGRKQEPRMFYRIAGRAEREGDDKTQFELKTALL